LNETYLLVRLTTHAFSYTYHVVFVGRFCMYNIYCSCIHTCIDTHISSDQPLRLDVSKYSHVYIFLYTYKYIYIYIHTYIFMYISNQANPRAHTNQANPCANIVDPRLHATGWRRLIGSPKLQIIFPQKSH